MKSAYIRWTDDELIILRRLWPSTLWNEIEKELPNRTKDALSRKASLLGISRHINKPPRYTISNLVEQLRNIRIARNLELSELAKLSGITASTIYRYENGLRKSNIIMLEKVINALNLELQLIPKIKTAATLVATTLPAVISKPKIKIAAAPIAAVVISKPKILPQPAIPKIPRCRIKPTDAMLARQVQEFIKKHGVTKLPPQAVAETSQLSHKLADIAPLRWDKTKKLYIRSEEDNTDAMNGHGH